ncbi:hypothetical protein TgHK011_000802 [Trichoderma gracile]|nr:hypothetical protein TgHK011_000802 [Trichoderma gracile]
MRLIPGPKSRDRRASPEELLLMVPALSLDVTHWITIAEKRTVKIGQRLQHIKHTHPGSPLRAIRTDKLLQMMNVRNAAMRRRILARVRGMLLKE